MKYNEAEKSPIKSRKPSDKNELEVTLITSADEAQRGIQGELTGHLRVTLVLTLFTFFIIFFWRDGQKRFQFQ